MRKELTWVAFALLASVFIVFIAFGSDTLDLRVQDRTIVLPSWSWAFPVFFLISFIILFSQISTAGFRGRKRCRVFLAFGFGMMVIMHFLRSYFVKLDVYLDEGKIWGFPLGTRELWHSRNTLGLLTFLQLGILASMLFVIYFCWIRTRKNHVNHY